jgi:hypothetical protein
MTALAKLIRVIRVIRGSIMFGIAEMVRVAMV